MKRSILTLTAAAALTLGGAASAQAATTCYTTDVPAVPAVYETTVIPAVTVTEYEFTHAQDGQGQGNGPANKWMEDPNWNAESNPQSVGWVATGNTRVRVVTVEQTIVTMVSPEIPATTLTECLDLPDGPVPDPFPEIPGHAEPVPVPAQEAPPAAVQEAPAPVALANVGAPVAEVQAAPVAAATAPEELAYTGAADWVLPAGAGLLALGLGTVALRRFI